MRFLGIGDSCDLGALYHRLVQAGHEVRVSIADPLAHGTLAGMVEQTPDWRGELAWIRAAGRDGVILFENVADARGALQDELRADGFQVIGGSAYGDRLENDRAYAQTILSEIGLPTAGMREFDDAASADAFLAANPARYVLKFNGPGYAASDNYVGQLADGRDVRALLKAKLRQRGAAPTSFVLMDHLDGVEMGVGAYFDGTEFLSPACLDWEHKRFFTGDLGELTGEMGTVVTYDRSRRFFELTLARMAPYLRRHGYCGYINLNTIVNERGIWPLEFSCRFTYPGFALLDALQETSWADLFRMMLNGGAQRFAVRDGFCVGIVLTTPPFPYTVKQVPEPVGLPVLFDGPLTPEDHANLHYGEVGLDGGELVTSGLYGWTMVVTGVAPTIDAAHAKACRLTERVLVPNLRYRRDIGDRLLRGEYARLEALGLLDDAGAATRA
jgi:phosphoribosylamine--glycine ligase